METKVLEKVLFYDGIPFMRYRLAYVEGEEVPPFIKTMTEGYRDYLENAYFEMRCRQYDEDTTRRKRIHHRPIVITQTVSLQRRDAVLSVGFDVCEDSKRCRFGVVLDTATGIVLTPKDLGVLSKKAARSRAIFYSGSRLLFFNKEGAVWETREIGR